VAAVEQEPAPARVWDAQHRALTAGIVSTIVFVATETLAVTTVMPLVRDDLPGDPFYGWVFSAFFLGSVLGVSLSGPAADRYGLARPYAVGVALFVAGLVLGGLAPHLGVLALARAIQGLGAGAIPPVTYAAIGRGYPVELRPRMFAVISTAWVVPGLVGPGLAGIVGDHVGWRWVFLGLVPLVGVSASLSLPRLRPHGPGSAPPDARFRGALRVAVGAALVLSGLGLGHPLALVGLVVAGVVIGLPALREVLPPGTLVARRGLPATVLSRGLLTWAFFGTDAFMPLALTEVRGTSATVAGLVVTAGAISWTTGSWIQERTSARVSTERLAQTGLVVLLVGIGLAALVLWDAIPVAAAPFLWLAAGLGIGLTHSPLSIMTLHQAPPGGEGGASASLQLADTLGIAMGTGIGGAIVAVGERGDGVTTGIMAATFGAAAVAAAVGVVVSRRLPHVGPAAAHATTAPPSAGPSS
jgi:MFS family permease